MHWIDQKTIYEDNHILIVDKPSGLLTQGDRTGDPNLFDMVKEHLKVKYNKPGNVYLGLINRLDRPVGGLVLLAKSSKAAERLHLMMLKGEIKKSYLVLCNGFLAEEKAELIHYLVKDESKNKTKDTGRILKRSNAGSESDLYLFAYRLEFVHPVSKELVIAVAYPSDKNEWRVFKPFFPNVE